MRMQMIALCAAVSLGLMTGAASAQVIKMPNVRPVQQVDTNTLTERVNLLEQQNAQLKAQLAQIQQQMTQNKNTSDSGFFADRFRITALEANQKQGGTTAQLSQSIGNLAGQLSALETKFANHTHIYQSTEVDFMSKSFVTDSHATGDDMGLATVITNVKQNPTSTSPPK